MSRPPDLSRESSDPARNGRRSGGSAPLVVRLSEVEAGDGSTVGQKAAALGALRRALDDQDVRIPDGFVTTRRAYDAYAESPLPVSAWSGLPREARRLHSWLDGRRSLRSALGAMFDEWGWRGPLDLDERCQVARCLCLATPVPPEVRTSLERAYDDLCREEGGVVDVAVRSSSVRADGAVGAHTGCYPAYLNVRGADALVDAWRRCTAGLFSAQAVSGRRAIGLDPSRDALPILVMRMVRADMASSGQIFTLEPDSGNRNVMLVSASYGLGSAIADGLVGPDTFLVWKEGLRRGACAVIGRRLGPKARKLVYATGDPPTQLVDVSPAERDAWSIEPAELSELARAALAIEQGIGRPVRLEWAKDGVTGRLFLLQALPESVHSSRPDDAWAEVHSMEPSRLRDLVRLGPCARGEAVGSRIATGRVRRYERFEEVVAQIRSSVGKGTESSETDGVGPDVSVPPDVFAPGDVLVTEATTPEWEPLMRLASLIVTERGGRTSHAAVVARELDVPAVVGCGPGARDLTPMSTVTGICSEGDIGYVLEGAHPFAVSRIPLTHVGELTTSVCLTLDSDERAVADAVLPVDGVGSIGFEGPLTRELGVHPLLIAHWEDLERYAAGAPLPEALEPFAPRIRDVGPDHVSEALASARGLLPPGVSPAAHAVDLLRDSVARVCAAFHPRPVLVRLSDLQSSECRSLIGGRLFEPQEENPRMGWRGAARHVDPAFVPAFELECRALRAARYDIGLDNLEIAVPFCRTPEEGGTVVATLRRYDLGSDSGVPVKLAVALPSNVVLADRFIDEMDLTGCVIEIDELVRTIHAWCDGRRDGRSDPWGVTSAARRAIVEAIARFRASGLEVAVVADPVSHELEDVLSFLLEQGVDSISVRREQLLKTRETLRRLEARLGIDPWSANGRPAVGSPDSLARDLRRPVHREARPDVA